MPLLTSEHASTVAIGSALQSVQLSKLRTEHGTPLLEAIVTKLLVELFKFKGNSPDVHTLTAWAKLIGQEYWHLKVDELVYVFRQGLHGKYGKIYGNIDYVTLTEWFGLYDKMKLNFLADQRQQAPFTSLGRTGETETISKHVKPLQK